MVKTIAEIKTHLQALKPTLLQYGITEMYVYGSFSKGKNHTDSDIDIAYTRNNNIPMGLHYFTILDLLEQDLGRKVDFVAIDAMNPIVKYYAEKDFIHV
jgi:predicted nucleotidyltransferase